MKPVSILNFDSFTDYLRVAARLRFAPKRGRLTLKKFAQKLGYRSPRTIGMVLTGVRLPSAEMVEQIGKIFEHDPKQQRYFQLLVMLERLRRRGGDLTPILISLKKLRGRHSKAHLPMDAKTFSFMAEWYYVAIKQLVEAPDFRRDAQWIRRCLRNKVTVQEIHNAIETMLEIGVLEEDAEGKLSDAKPRFETSQDIFNAALRNFHKQMIARGLEAIEEQPLLDREIHCTTLRCDPKQMKEMKKALRELRQEIVDRFHDPQSNHVYQLNQQCFAHTLAT